MERLISLLQKGTRIAFDTSICIYFFEGHPLYNELLMKLFSEVEDEHIDVFYSTLLLTELYTGPLKNGDVTTVQIWNKYFKHYPAMNAQPVDEEIAFKASVLRAKYNLKTPDAIHLATALYSQVKLFLTNDSALKKITEIKVLCLDDLL